MEKTRPCRVAILTHELTGGVGTMTRFLYRTLSESGAYEPVVILLATSARDTASVAASVPATWRDGPRVVSGIDRGLPYLHVGAWLTEFEFQRYRPRQVLDNLLRDFDVLQFVAGVAPLGSVAERVNKPKCLWIATTVAGDREARVKQGSLPRRLWSLAMMKAAQAFEKRALKLADSVIALSPYTSESLRKLMHGQSVPLGFCGVDTELFHPVDRREFAENGQSEYILCVARLFDPRKNVEMLLRAYAAILQNDPNAPELRLVGEPLSPEALQLLQRLGVAEKVRCYGPTHGEELAALYRNAMLFVLPSDEEGLGIVILEAMASGLPVVSTACGGPEVAVDDGETGLLTPVGDEEALTRAMLRLIADSALRDRYGAAGRRKIEREFSLPVTTAVFLRQYERFCAADPVASN